MKRYPSQYAGPDTGPGRCLKLLEDASPKAGLALDIGCGRAPLAERIGELGLEYVGIDVDSDALAAVRSRGYEAHQVDLGASRDELTKSLQQIVADRPLSAILTIDVLEHLIEPAWVLEALRALWDDGSDCSLIVSVPNVTHLDIASKLLVGRWDLTEFGLLDDTHLRFFSERLFSDLFASTGWKEVVADDIVTPISDQQFPLDSPFLRPAAPGRDLLNQLSSRAHASSATYQFVRRFAPVDVPPGGHKWAIQPDSPEDGAFATVLVHAAQADRGVQGRILDELDAQSSRDFETILLHAPGGDGAVPERPGVRVVEAAPEEAWNAGIAAASGRYICFLDATVRVSSQWIEAFRASPELAGNLLKCQVVSVPSRGFEGDATDELVASGKHLHINPVDLLHPTRRRPTILAAYAIPLEAARTAGVLFEPKYGPAAPAVFLSRTAELCGIASLPAATVAVRNGGSENEVDLSLIARALDDRPLILPRGSASRIVELQKFKWRLTLPTRGLKRIFTRLRGGT